MSVGVAIFIQRKDFPSNSFYVVVVVKTEDEACGGPLRFYPLRPDELIDAGNRSKNLDVMVSPAINRKSHPHKGCWCAIQCALLQCKLAYSEYVIPHSGGVRDGNAVLFGNLFLLLPADLALRLSGKRTVRFSLCFCSRDISSVLHVRLVQQLFPLLRKYWNFFHLRELSGCFSFFQACFRGGRLGVQFQTGQKKTQTLNQRFWKSCKFAEAQFWTVE